MTPEKQNEWFLKWQQVVPGSKRRFEECFGEELSRESEFLDERAVDDWLPIREYKAYRRMENPWKELTDTVLEDEFEEIVRTNDATCKWERNQWHVPIYRGIRRGMGALQSHEVVSGARRRLHNDSEMRDFIDQGRRGLEAFGATILPVPNVPQQILATEASEADQATLQQPVLQSTQLINREVYTMYVCSYVHRIKQYIFCCFFVKLENCIFWYVLVKSF